MSWWSELKYLIRKINQRRAERELEEEIRTHLELETREKIEAGFSPEEARYAARRAFGSVAFSREESRAWWGFETIEILWQDLRYGMRMLCKNPTFSFVALSAIALGIGANTAVFSVVNAVLLRPLPYPHSEQLVKVMQVRTKTGLTEPDHSYLNFTDYRDRNSSFEIMAAYADDDATLLVNQVPERIEGLTVSADFFKLLGMNMQLGRAFTADDEQPGAESVIVSHELWQRRLGENPKIIGLRLMLDGKQRIVIGVTRPNFSFPFKNQEMDFFRTFDPKGGMEVQRGASYIEVLGKLRSGAALARAEADMQTIASSLERQHIELNAGKNVSLISAREYLVGNLDYTLLILFGAVGFVLLIACANVANLQLARASVRERETAIRAALGASRRRIIRQLLTESLVFSISGGLIGLLISVWCTDLILKFVPTDIPRIKEVGLDLTVIAFSFGLSLLTGALFGLVPALQSSLVDLNESLKEGGRSATGGQRRNRFRSLLIVLEVALSLVLLIGAGLLIKSFQQMRHTNPGFNSRNVLTASITLPSERYPQDGQQLEFYQQAIERISNIPDVEAAGAIMPLPYSNNGITTSFTIDGLPEPELGAKPRAGGRIITPGYIRAMGIPLIKGRLFTDHDDAAAPKVLLINESLARRYFPGQDPIGRRLKLGLNSINGEIVGVVGDVRGHALNREALPECYVPYAHITIDSMSIIARAKTGDPMNLAASIRTAVREIDKDLPVFQLRSMESRVSDSLTRERFSMTLLSVLAALALVLAVAGIFSIMSFLVAQRSHEIGIRTALGAQRLDVFKLVLGQGMRLTLIGMLIGLFLSFALTRLIKEFLYQVDAVDPLTYVVVSLILAGAALVACWMPARRATRLDPLSALRCE
ncbi:MAG: ABC transporter permease [Acidobacteria bacterium]|nr:ABC transporter permease [Acidobacteriota bacterium]